MRINTYYYKDISEEEKTPISLSRFPWSVLANIINMIYYLSYVSHSHHPHKIIGGNSSTDSGSTYLAITRTPKPATMRKPEAVINCSSSFLVSRKLFSPFYKFRPLSGYKVKTGDTPCGRN